MGSDINYVVANSVEVQYGIPPSLPYAAQLSHDLIVKKDTLFLLKIDRPLSSI